MIKILEALATDHLSAEPDISRNSKEYSEARDLSSRLGEELRSKLIEDEKKLLEEYFDALSEESSLYAVERFITGFRIGMLMTMEVISGSDALILKTDDIK